MNINDMRELIRKAGFNPSVGSWEDASRIYVFSMETYGPATYGHPRYALDYKKDTNKLYHDNREVESSSSKNPGQMLKHLSGVTYTN